MVASTALAYSPSGAVAHADQWATNSSWCNNHLCFTQDCTNFVSYALHYGGGYQMVPGGSNTDDHYWYLTGWPWLYSHSWTVANDLYTFQMWHYPGGYLKGTALGSSNYSWDGISAGDLVFYDWDGNGSKGPCRHSSSEGIRPC